MAINLHLQNLSVFATDLDVRRFFTNYEIAKNGVNILGGPDGDAFITFRHDSDILKAISLSSQNLLGQVVKLRIISRYDMEEIIQRRRKSEILLHPQMTQSGPMTSNGGANRFTKQKDVGDTAHLNPYFDSEMPNQDYRGDSMQASLHRGPQYRDEAMGHDDYYLKTLGQHLRGDTGREREQINLQMSRDGWNDGQCGMDDRHEKQKRQQGSVDTVPGYVRLDNLPASIGHSELEGLFNYYKMRVAMPNGIIRSQGIGDSSAFVKLSSRHDALRADELNEVEMQGHMVHLRMISESQYNGSHQMIVPKRQSRWGPANKIRDNNLGTIPPSQYQAGYIRISYLPASMWYKELQAFLHEHMMGYDFTKTIITMKQETRLQMSTALVEFPNYQTAVTALTLDNIKVGVCVLKVEIISKDAYDVERERWSAEQARAREIQSVVQAKQRERPSVGQANKQKLPVIRGIGKETKQGYIRMRNLPSNVSHTMLRELFQQHNFVVAKNAISVHRDLELQLCMAMIWVPDPLDAQRAAVSLRNCELEGQIVTVEQISVGMFYEEKKKQRERMDSGIQGKGLPTELPDDVNYSSPGHVMIRNLSLSVKFKELRAFFREFGLTFAKSGIVLKVGAHSSTAYVKFSTVPGGLKLDLLDCRRLKGKGVKIETISAHMFQYQQFSSIKRPQTQLQSITEPQPQPQSIKEPQTQPQTFTDPNSLVAPSGKFECFIKFDQLTDDTTACEIWDWFGGKKGLSKGVLLVRRVDDGDALYAYVAFSNVQHRNAELAKNDPCKPVSADKTYRHLADVGPLYKIFESTNMGMDREMLENEIAQRAQINAKPPLVNLGKSVNLPKSVSQIKSVIFADMVECANAGPGNSKFLCFMRVPKVAADASAWGLWKQQGGPSGCCKGVVVVRGRNEQNELCTIFAYLAFKDYMSRSAALKAAGLKKRWSAKATFENLARADPCRNIIECTTPGKERELSKDERDLLSQMFHFKVNKESNADITAIKPSSGSPNAENRGKVSDQQSIFSQLILGAKSPLAKQLGIIRVLADSMPEDATASGMCRWLSGPDASCNGSILVRTSAGDPVCVFIAFKNKAHSKAALVECEGGSLRTGGSTRREIVMYGSEYDVFESTAMGNDNKVSEKKRKELQKLTPLGVKEMQSEGRKRKAENTNVDEMMDKKIKVEEKPVTQENYGVEM